MSKYNVMDLFSGVGGLSYGFSKIPDFNILAANEIEKDISIAYSLNHPNVAMLNCDINQLTEEKLKEVLKDNRIDLIVGGPPCQSYSTLGKRKMDDRANLFMQYKRVLSILQPKAFVFENVPGLLTACPGDIPVRIRIFDAFKAIGYEIRTPENLKNSVYCAEDYGVPQKRNRIIIFGTKKDSNFSPEDFYSCLTKNKTTSPHKTVRDAIGNLPALIPSREITKVGNAHISHHQVSGEKVNLHIPRYHGERDQRLFKEWLSNNMNAFSQEEKKAFYTKITGHTSNHIKYRNLEWDKPSPTIVAHLYKDGYMFIHPDIKQLRTITVREAALLQSFPLDYSFPSSNSYNYKMIGNAVPVLFAKAIAETVYEVISNKEVEK